MIYARIEKEELQLIQVTLRSGEMVNLATCSAEDFCEALEQLVITRLSAGQQERCRELVYGNGFDYDGQDDCDDPRRKREDREDTRRYIIDEMLAMGYLKRRMLFPVEQREVA